jgi:hypothetical protein
MANETDLAHLLPISNKGTALFSACRDGILLSKLLNRSVAGTINTASLNKNIRHPVHMSENLIKVLDGCKSIGVKVHNICPQDIIDAVPHLCLSIISQILKVFVYCLFVSRLSLDNSRLREELVQSRVESARNEGLAAKLEETVFSVSISLTL